MRRFSLILAILLMTAPAWARVDIICTQDDNEVTVSYVVVGEDPNEVRAFALDISLSDDVNIIGIGNYKTGESESSDRGYGIFPASFDQYIDPNDPNWDDENYSPLANPADHPDHTLPGLDTNGITVELGSLYDGDANKPVNSGVLFSFYVERQDCDVTITQNQIRRGIVLADSNSAVSEFNSPGCSLTFECLVVGQYVGGRYITQDMYDVWSGINKPDCWCYDCHWLGDTDGDCDVDSGDVTAAIWGWDDYWTWPNHCPDTDNDGDVDSDDIMNMIVGWNEGCTDPNHPDYPNSGTCAPIP